MATVTRIQNNQITDSTINAQYKVAQGTVTGNLFAPTLTLNSNITILGNLTISNSFTQLNSINTYINDPLVVFNNGYTGSPSYDIGMLMNRNLQPVTGYNSASVNTAWVWEESASQFQGILTTETGTTAGVINNSGFANLRIGNLFSQTHTVSNNLSVGTTLSVTGNITSSANILGTLYDAGTRVVSTTSGAGNLTITSNSISLTPTGPGAVNVGSSANIPTIVTDAYGRIVSLTSNAVSTSVSLAGTSGSGSFAGGGTLTFSSTNGVTIAVGTSYANISTPQDVRTTAAVAFANVTATNGNLTATNGNIVAINNGGILTLYGNAITSNTGIINFGSISNVQIFGGSTGYAVTTNGTGTLSFSAANVIYLGANSSGQLVSNAVALTSTTDVTDAIAQLNAILGKLTPASPPNFPATSFTQSTGTISGLMTAFTQTDNSGWGNLSVSGGTAVSVVRSATFATSTVTNSGTTTTGGNIQLAINGSIWPSNYHALTSSPSSADNGTYGNLVVSGVQDYHNIVSTVAAGFWYVFSASVAATSIPAGWNRVNITYTGDNASTNTLTWYYDSSAPSAPAFSATSMAISSNVVTYSSGIPHLNSSSGFTLKGSVQNLSGDIYPNSTNLISSSATATPFAAPALVTYTTAGVTTPITRNNTTVVSFSTTSNISTGWGSAASTVGPTVTVTNGYTPTTSAAFASGNIILYKTGTTGFNVEETSLTNTLTGTPSTFRITNPDTGTAADNPAYTGSESAFNSATSTLYATDATCVAAKLQYDVTNYSSGYLPVGPNLSSGRSASQYFTFKFAIAATSNFSIHYVGTIAGLWVAIPGVTEPAYASPTNGWLNCAVAYGGAGIPGTGTGANGVNGVGNAGTATLNSNGTYTAPVTFGGINTSSSGNKGNEIYVRVKLTSGQSLTSLYISA